jgi:hypothetical protein
MSRAGLLPGALLLAWAVPALAGGPMVIWQPGRPYLWPDGGLEIPFHPDRGALGTLSAQEAAALTAEAFGQWQEIPSAGATYVNAGLLPVDVDVTNFFPYLFPSAPDGQSAVVFDENGGLFTLLFGFGSGVLGFAGPEWIDTSNGEILEGVCFLNGESLLLGLPVEEYFGVMVHEFGHYSNLAHSVVNGEIVTLGDSNGPSQENPFPFQSLSGRIETMYPFKLVGGGDATPHPDDIAIFSTLYPAPGFFGSTGSITGTVFAPNGETPINGVNVIARNIDDPFDDAVSAITGDFSANGGAEDPYTGVFTLNGLTPGSTYAVFVDEIGAGAFSTPPINPLPGVEEFYNGANESTDATIDDRLEFTGLSPSAGEVITGVDILFNRIPPGPLAMEDDASLRLYPPFPVSFCGEEYISLVVNANGNMTFGGPSAEYLDSASAFLSGPPRIAGLWEDLNPGLGGTVSYDETPNSFTLRFHEVPRWPARGSHSFDITLHRASDRLDLSYGLLTGKAGLVGYSCGGEVASRREPETSLLQAEGSTINGRNASAVYEWFTDRDNELDGITLRFTLPGAFRDRDEPNGTLEKATRVALPFRGDGRFQEMRPAGDLDFYRFRAPAGSTLVAETLPGNPGLDTILGLFDADTGELLAVDDNRGQGLLSRIVHEIPSDGRYAVAVSTFPDFELEGDGEMVGRYVLDLQAVDEILSPSEDGTVEVPMGEFAFPFQGEEWTGVWINANGNLTFGRGDPDFTESVQELLDGPPRIAPLWTDLSPIQGGRVTLERTADSLTVRFFEVPEFAWTVGNTFAVTLLSDGTVIFRYDDLNSSSALAGLTGGGGAADPGEVDLSVTEGWTAAGTTYELFDPGELDLAGRTLVFHGDGR